MPFCLQRTMLHLATNIIIYRKPTYLLRVKTPGALRQKHRISGVLQGSANGSASGGPEAPRFGQLRGHSVFNTPHLSHYVFVPFWHLTTFLVTYIHSLSPLWPRNARRRDNGRTRFGNRAAPRLSRRAGRPKPRHAKNGARPALCGRDEVREGHLLLKNLRSAARPLRPRPALPRQGSANGREIAAQGQSGRSIRPCFYVA